jgi:hypothetical protein
MTSDWLVDVSDDRCTTSSNSWLYIIQKKPKSLHRVFCLVRFHSLVLVSESFSCNTFVHNLKLHTEHGTGHRGLDRMVVGFTTTYATSAYHHWCCEFESRSGRGVQHYVIKFVSNLVRVVFKKRCLMNIMKKYSASYTWYNDCKKKTPCTFCI